MSIIEFNDRVAIVTGAGGGLGRSHALELARRGVKVVVNDLGGSVSGVGGSATMAENVVEEIRELGGTAMANGANVTNPEEVQDMVSSVIEKWGHIDILVNNAGILRDKSFTKMDINDFRLVIEVHLMGSVICTKAVWDHMKERKYGRIVMTTSSSGNYGNFGQTNYGAAKTGVVGLMNTLCLEGAKYDIRVNALSPTAATRMTESLMPQEALDLLTVDSVTAGLIPLVCDGAPNRLIMCAGAGGYAATKVFETSGIHLAPNEQTAENVMINLDKIRDSINQEEYTSGGQQTMKFVGNAAKNLGIN
ncbi:MAG: SDR family NAD(P)-dependent oxidoreductase [Hellea sp.]|jgi:NAD(P)-dependent dehydrogenase (short-subunit alcohol dehydrogenase family)|nr:SDR family NAD(P)-dependent oxidoreductase [Hellea sp.]MBT3593502.1 SDR family NAD(P)-dependent oxidoreductase [Hellea sp.]MBT4996358.1 SDR family NAD(P)-dependent oxidoreductase [Hellea sp.]MBT5835770.1 SDR family NAD(P)-dependent oxidoreductase [Hellea sp.]MDA8888515.1 SDR family NAD(P)-dependent oxidoreductase [Hellea sp.]MDB4845075.1 SDR family NAD(P)-dependent oxidoreductase [Hellea sp.]